MQNVFTLSRLFKAQFLTYGLESSKDSQRKLGG